MARTSRDLRETLAEKVQIDPNTITCMFWVNPKGLKVLVDDAMVQHLPEAQIMTAHICELPYAEPASTGSRPSAVQVKLLF